MAIALTPLPEGKLYFAGKGQQIPFKITLSSLDSAETEDLYINVHIRNEAGLIPEHTDEEKKYTRSFPAIKDGDEYYAEIDVNDLVHGIYQEVMSKRPEGYNHQAFSFPGDPDEPLQVVEEKYLLYASIAVSYSYNNAGVMVESDEIGGSFETQYKFRALAGGASRIMRGFLKDESKELIDFITDEQKFLTWMPDEMRVHPRQPVRLFFYSSSQIDMNVRAEVFYTDGTSETTLLQDYPGVNLRYLVEISCGIPEMHLHLIDINKKIQKYQVWLVDGDWTRITEKRTFIVDYKQYERNNLFFFRNSFGVIETFWAHGNRKDEVEASKSQHHYPLTKPSSKIGSLRASRGEFQQMFQTNTGYFPKKHRSYILDFLNSDEVWYPAGWAIHPVIVEAERWNFGEDQVDVFDLDFTFSMAHKENYYSAEPPVESPFGDFNNDFNNDFFVS